MPPITFALPTCVCTLSGVSIAVVKSPIARTVPVTSPASTKSPTLNGRSTRMNAPAAKFERSPPHAAPIAMPSAAMSAANDVVSTPK